MPESNYVYFARLKDEAVNAARLRHELEADVLATIDARWKLACERAAHLLAEMSTFDLSPVSETPWEN